MRSTLRLVIALAVSSALGVAARAADTPLFDYRQITLDNGLKVITLEDHSTPIVEVQVWYHVGSKDENPERQGFAHMFEHMMFRGTDHLGPKDHFELLRRCGGDANAYTAFDNTTYHQTVPANQLGLVLWLEAERMTFLKIDQESFDTERKVVEEERRMGVNRPYGTVLEDFLPKVFGQHPYRWSPIGNIPMLRATEVKELRAFWTKYYVPNNATLVIVGDVTHAQAQEMAKQSFGWIPRGADPERVTYHEPLPTAAQKITIKADSAPAPVTAIVYRTVPVGHDDYLPLQMLATILGGGESSRLHRELVADKELAVVAVSMAFSLEQDGLFAAGAVLSPVGGKIKKVQNALRDNLAKLRSSEVSDAELEKVRNQMLRGVVTDNLTVASKASLLGNAAVIEGDVARVNQRLDRIRKVTKADLQRVAQTYLAPEHAFEVTVEQNLLGALFGKKKAEDDAPITANKETDPPAPGRAGAKRPADWPQQAPVAKLADAKVTPEFTTETLPNGLKVVTVTNKEIPFVSISLDLTAGSWTESKPGAASMALQMLSKGTAKYNDEQLANELESNAINLGGGADMDSASVSASCLPEQLERATALLAEVVQHPTFPPKEFEKLRKQVRTGLAVSTVTPEYLADRELRRRMYGPAHPYSRTETGELEDVDALKVEDAQQWWATYARPDMASLYFAGDIDPATARKLAEGALGSWAANGPAPSVHIPAPQSAEPKIYLVDQPGVQSQIRIGCLSIDRKHPDYFASRVVSSYFGGAFNSRLNDAIRVKRGLTYGAGGGFGVERFAGRFTAHTFTKQETTADTVRAVLEEIDRLKKDGPTETELSDTKSYVLGSFPGDRETPQQVASALWSIQLNDLPADYYDRMLSAIAQTTAADCARVIAAQIDSSKMIIVVVGNAAKIKADLEAIRPVEVIERKPAAAPTAEDKPEE